MNSSVKVWQVDAGAFVSGRGSRQLVIDVGGTAIWSPSERAWSFAPKRIADVLALAEHRGRRTEWLGVRGVAS